MTNDIKPQKRKFLKILFAIEKIAQILRVSRKSNKRGRPRKFGLFQIIACLVYKVKNSITSFRELEYKINEDREFRRAIGIEKSPDHSYFAKYAAMIEEKYLADIKEILGSAINPDTSICVVDSTPLRSSKNDRHAATGVCAVLGFYNGYKLHLLVTGKDEIIPLAWEFSCANEHDSQKIELLYRAWIYGAKILIADAGYDSEKWFKAAQELEIKFVAGVNKRNMKNKDNVRSELRAENMKYLETEEGKKVYRKRTMIERLFSKLKGEYKLENMRLRGFRTYKRHVEWILITYLFEEFIRKLEKRKFTLAYVWNQFC